MIWRLLFHLIGGCSHPSTYRERRTYRGVENVLHAVCDACGYAAPLLTREPEQAQAAIQAGAVRLPTAQRETAADRQRRVLPMPRRTS